MKNKLRLGIDIDDVLLGLVSELDKFYNKKHGTDFERDDHIVYALSDAFNSTMEEAIHEVKCFYESSYFDKMKPLKDAVRVIKKLQKKFDCYVITSRPDYIKDKTISSVNKYFPGLLKKDNSNLFFPSDWHDNDPNYTKAKLCIDHKIDFMIDDRLKYAKECAEAGVNSILFDSPWNGFDQIIEYAPGFEHGKVYSSNEEAELYSKAIYDLPPNMLRMHSWKDIESLLDMV